MLAKRYRIFQYGPTLYVVVGSAFAKGDIGREVDAKALVKALVRGDIKEEDVAGAYTVDLGPPTFPGTWIVVCNGMGLPDIYKDADEALQYAVELASVVTGPRLVVVNHKEDDNGKACA